MKLFEYPPPRKGMCYEFKYHRWKVTNVIEDIVYFNIEYSSGDIAYNYSRSLEVFYYMLNTEARLT